MRRARIGRPSPAMVVSVIALGVALGGTGYAAVTLPRNSVGSGQLKAGAVKTSDLARSAVTSSRVKDGSLLARDFGAGQLPAGPAGARGPTGATGATGATGPAGPAGSPGLSGLEQVFTIGTFDSSSPKEQSVTCPAGKQVVGTGYNLNAVNNNAVEQHLHVMFVLVSNDLTTVQVRASEDATGTAGNWNIVAQAVCAKVAG